jgi:heme exporter protein D
VNAAPPLGHLAGDHWLSYVAYLVPLAAIGIAIVRERILMRRDRQRVSELAAEHRDRDHEGESS